MSAKCIIPGCSHDGYCDKPCHDEHEEWLDVLRIAQENADHALKNGSIGSGWRDERLIEAVQKARGEQYSGPGERDRIARASQPLEPIED